MSKVKLISIIYAIGIIIGALFFDVWGVNTTSLKTMSVFGWTVIFIITLFCNLKSGTQLTLNLPLSFGVN